MTTTTRKQTPAQARRAALESDYAPLYAVAGLTEAVATTVQTTLAETSAKAGQRFAAWQDRNEKQAKAAANDAATFVRSLPEQVKALPETTKARLTDWQKQAQDRAQALVREANTTYGDLAGRGKKAVDETLSSSRQLSGRAERRATDARSDLTDAVDPAFEKVQETVTRARKTATGRTATETVTPRSTQKATATRAAARGAAGERAAAKKATAKKAANKAAKA